MVQVDLGPHDARKQACHSDKDCANPTMQSWPSSIVTTVVTSEFEASHPAETALMRNLSFTNNLRNSLLAWHAAAGATGDEAAVYSLSHQHDLWGGWSHDACPAKPAAALKDTCR